MKSTASRYERQRTIDLDLASPDRPTDEMVKVVCGNCQAALYLKTRTVNAKTWQCPACNALTRN
jgi:hypothetical protein